MKKDVAWKITVGQMATGKTRYAEKYAAQEVGVKVIGDYDMAIDECVFSEGHTEIVVVETPSPSVAQAVVACIDETYHVTPEVWAFARRGQVHRLLGDLNGMNVTKLLIPEEARNPDGAWQEVVRQPDGTWPAGVF